jgi:hypothetical protein
VNLGALVVGSSPSRSSRLLDLPFFSYDDLEDPIEIASLPNVESEPEIDVWEWHTYRGGLTGDSWTWYIIFAVDGLR